jgi:hypothetical protein
MLHTSTAALIGARPLSFPAMLSHKTARVSLPADIAAMLARFGLSLDGLLTDNNAKLIKGAAIARAVIHHTLPARALAAAIDPGNGSAVAPRGFLPALAALADQTGLTDRARRHNGCPWATAGCANACLVWAGHGGLSAAVATARGRRTLAMIGEPETYGRAILWAIARQHAKAAADGLPLAVRLRGTDDRAWHLQRFALSPAESQAIRRRFGLITDPGETVSIADATATARADGSVKLYEYSKAATHGQTGLIAQRAAGFDVTASLAADRSTAARDAMAAALAGFRIAIPVDIAKGEPLPARVAISHNGQTVIMPAVAGDETDHRWADPAAVAVILRAKRSRGADPAVSGFILPNAPVVRLPDGLIQLLPV